MQDSGTTIFFIVLLLTENCPSGTTTNILVVNRGKVLCFLKCSPLIRLYMSASFYVQKPTCSPLPDFYNFISSNNAGPPLVCLVCKWCKFLDKFAINQIIKRKTIDSQWTWGFWGPWESGALDSCPICTFGHSALSLLLEIFWHDGIYRSLNVK